MLQPLSNVLLDTDHVSFQVVGEQPCNDSICLVLHGEITDAGLRKSKPPLPAGTNVTADVWLDTQKDLAIVQSKYRVEGRNYIETAITLAQYGGHWFPKKITREEHWLTDGNDRLVHDVSFEIRELTIGQAVDASLFTLDGLGLPPRTNIVDHINGIEYSLHAPD